MADTSTTSSAVLANALRSLAPASQHFVERPFVPLPPAKLRALLDPRCVVILGYHGSGKSLLANRLVDKAKSLGLPDATIYLHGFKNDIPLRDLPLDRDDQGIRTFWLLDLLGRLIESVPALGVHLKPDLLDRTRPDVDLATLGAVSAALDRIEQDASAPELVVVYDGFNRIDPGDPTVQQRLVRGLLGLWVGLSSRYRKIRAKIFLGDDLLDLSTVLSTDVSKLLGRAETLAWSDMQLYRVVLSHLAGQNEEMRKWLEGFGIGCHLGDDETWLAEEPDEKQARSWLTQILRNIVAVNGTRSPVEAWVANRLRDGNNRITPFAMLSFFSAAGWCSLSRRHQPLPGHAIAVEDAVHGIHRAGSDRFLQIRDVYPWAMRVIALQGRQVPMSCEEMTALLGEDDPRFFTTPPRDGRTVLRELLALGALRSLNGRKIDVPDVYVPHFGVRRA